MVCSSYKCFHIELYNFRTFTYVIFLLSFNRPAIAWLLPHAYYVTWWKHDPDIPPQVRWSNVSDFSVRHSLLKLLHQSFSHTLSLLFLDAIGYHRLVLTSIYYSFSMTRSSTAGDWLIGLLIGVAHQTPTMKKFVSALPFFRITLD
jgi:hypothetical protein